MQTVIPPLRITDAPMSLSYYVDGLGFSADWQHQFEVGFPLFLQLTRNGQTIFLSEHSGDCQVGGAIYFKVASADACWKEFAEVGIMTTNELTSTP